MQVLDTVAVGPLSRPSDIVDDDLPELVVVHLQGLSHKYLGLLVVQLLE